ncbi:hypothetical protein DM860_009593 [Cuscuta australis]|uniref:Epidermal patterning factor-like protein n=1 Tax=Cuscuta australis TaxID=267555 RepID=A0A328DN46_9ASTE|nr:hypothetical protein DM860_009593 [Cuscuta australis]
MYISVTTYDEEGNGLHNGNNNQQEEEERNGRRGEVAYPTAMAIRGTGSSLPDCSHACGACFPCKRVMVSFKCSVAESCPVVYRCMCRGKYYHVPSN